VSKQGSVHKLALIHPQLLGTEEAKGSEAGYLCRQKGITDSHLHVKFQQIFFQGNVFAVSHWRVSKGWFG